MTAPYKYEVLPETLLVLDADGLLHYGRGKFKTTCCVFHGGRDSMRINSQTGAFNCMACGVQGEDEVAYLMQRHGIGREDATKVLDELLRGSSDYERTLNKVLPPAIEQALLELENEQLKNCDSSQMEGDA